MKATLEFDLEDYDDKLAHKRAINASDAYLVLHQIGEKLFRPARKHGYGQYNHIQSCIDKAIDDNCEIDDPELSDFKDNVVTQAISAIETQFYELLEEYNIDMRDLP